jgi:methyltransferase-like protein 6
VGCGCGNTAVPLLVENTAAVVHACDFSPRAVQVTQQRAQEAGVGDRLHGFVRDVTKEPLTPEVAAHSCDVVTLIFALSAMSPDAQARAVAHCAAVLAQPHGVVCVRDYAAGDLAELRLDAKAQKLGDSFYVRSDGTRAFYFTPPGLVALFAGAGLQCRSVRVCEKDVVNRAKQLHMERRWIQAEFVWPGRDDEVRQGPTEADDIGVVDDSDLAQALFLADVAASRPQWSDVACGGLTRTLRLRLMSREAQHTCRVTGQMLWHGACALAHHLTANPGCVAGARVLELGAGAAGLPSFAAAAAGAAQVTATDGHSAVVELLTGNVEANADWGAPTGVAVHVARLRWGNGGDGAPFAGACDVVVAADVVYSAGCLPELFRTVSSALAPGGLALLCHVADRGAVTEGAVIDAAAAQGISLTPGELHAPAVDGAVCRLLVGRHAGEDSSTRA